MTKMNLFVHLSVDYSRVRPTTKRKMAHDSRTNYISASSET